jgi:D-alanyl-D-alanine carboxypeptidase
MKKTVLLLLIIFASIGTVRAQFPATYANRLQFVLDSVSAVCNIKGVSAAVTVPGLGTWEGVYGISETGVPMSSSMALGIGSNTKTFIASTIMKMEEQNLISLGDTVGTWIQHPNVNGQITIKQLLNHTSGLFSYTAHPDFVDSMAANFTRVWQPQEILQFVGTPSFPAGTSWGYSNTNYLLLGLIIEQLMGQPMDVAVRNAIMTPAGLNSTWFFPQEATAPVAHSWSAAFNGSGNYLQDLVTTYGYTHTSGFSLAWAAGAMMSTAADNALFWSKLISGQIVSAASLVKMKQVVNPSATISYGLGIFRRKNFNGRTIYNHGGTNLGFINESLADSISGVGISVLTNQDSVNNNLLLTKVVAALHKVTINPPLSVDQPAALAISLSVYPNPARDVIAVTGFDEGNPATLRIYDFTGRLVYDTRITSYGNIELPELSNGTYLLKVASINKAEYGSTVLQVAR